jgi:tRNA threonylcarbamoyladenosine biosynthesis protein TsaB
MSLILHLETATKACSVALSEHGECIAVKESFTENFTHGENLTLYIQDVLRVSGKDISELKAVSVASGPGSYTGLRIGVSTAKGLCFALDIPLIAIDALHSMAAIARMKYPELNICPLIDARRMEVFSAIYSSDFQVLKPISADIIDETSYDAYEPFVCFGDGASKLQDIWKNRSLVFDLEIQASAKGQIVKAFEKFQKNEFEDLAYFEPFYLKDFITTQPKKP